MHIRRAEEEKAKKKERNVRYNTLVICRGLTVSHPLYLVRFVFASLAVTGTVKCPSVDLRAPTLGRNVRFCYELCDVVRPSS